MAKKKKGKGRGWHGDSAGHSRAAKKGKKSHFAHKGKKIKYIEHLDRKLQRKFPGMGADWYYIHGGR